MAPHCCTSSEVRTEDATSRYGGVQDAIKEHCIRIPTGGKVSYTCKMNSCMVFHSISIYSPWHLP